ncbi:succinyl-CoA--3-ketoacid-CoA transferase [Rhodoplanes sp. TEM]|uniref:Succinyl-CoA--3-ketoacid-CoA transferase n=1 Tax=Rhodoplanes tepidamans TaxID=200616 RepID=A0ABT5JGG0_RHOTP|nr:MULTISPECIES: CoA-transferase [Rhodoplanes]MDC7788573.1 succinyl-CoA--3-ketoacid-CoA transferase [Rhodoplanes tepidamans]MDC7986791.1 succinyl-CoA--3-ketoacid-CoA transferase [Rhodoplanes sp. TEM]MDQ0358555.1 3-oxoacid CoA-transferase B subunit [Rhodoplanes tepidamans]
MDAKVSVRPGSPDLARLSPREIIARRCAAEVKDGEVVNLGFGIPTLTSNYLPKGMSVIFHAENGCFGFGAKPGTLDADSDITNAGCEPITLLPGACVMPLTTSFGAMRNGFIDITVLGALEVDQEGNLANWAAKRNGHWWPGPGGAMDLCYGVKRVIAALQHIDKAGDSKVKRRSTLPLTGTRCIKVIVTDKAVFDVKPQGGLILREAFPGLGVEDIRAITEAEFEVAPDFGPMKLGLN